ncbi:MAG: ankyrin repeat domain-containing protein [Thermoanaerobaculia bacterium]
MLETIVDRTSEAGVAAARAGDARALGEWLDAGGNPEGRDGEGWTPLLAASARGHEEAVALLLERGASPDTRQGQSAALPIHFAGHSGSIGVASRLLELRPGHLDEIWDINGHTLLLQAVFYGFVDLAKFAVERGANTAAMTLRGLTALDLARQFQNAPMIELLQAAEAPAEAKSEYYKRLLERVAPVTLPEERATQERSDRLVAAIEAGIARAAADASTVPETIATVREMLRETEVNRLGGPLRQPPLIVAVTGNNGNPANPAVAEVRYRIAELLLEKGADPTLHEVHPMGAQPIIRACVFNHLEILELMSRHMSAEVLRDALNEIPIVNGLTALHDSVLRASMTSPDRLEGYLSQIRWAVGSGARSDIEDFSGRTQRSIAAATADPERRRLLLDALGIHVA